MLKADSDAFTESPNRMVNRVLRNLKGKKNIIVFNDEAHHCYRYKQANHNIKDVDRDEKEEIDNSNEQARVWISGIEAVKRKCGIKTVYDLSATPYFRKGSGYSQLTADGKRITEGVLFPWVVSDFSLIDAIESADCQSPARPH